MAGYRPTGTTTEEDPMGVRPMVAGGSAALIVLALTACGSAGTTGSGDQASPTGAADCGTVTLSLGQSVIPDGPLSCLSDAAAAGTDASLVVQTPTTEGDPITTTYTVVDTGRVRVVVDSTQDAFAGDGAGITQQTCSFATAAGRIIVASCTSPEPV